MQACEIPKTMKALVVYGKGDYRLETSYPVPDCGPDEILVKTEGCGVCTSDVKCQHGAARYWGSETEAAWVRTPFIPGHEFLGRVVKTGQRVTEFAVGDRVTADQIVPCGQCRYCKSGRYWMCQPHNIFGFQTENNGGMAEYVRYPKNAVLHKVPQDMPLSQALLIEPFACAKHCIDRAQLGSEDVVVISGAGTLGLGMITYARSRNPGKLVVLDLLDARLEKARAFGADLTWNPGREDVYALIADLTEGYGCDTYIECSGHPASVAQGLKMIRKLGRFVEFSVFGEPATVDWSTIGDGKELDVLGSHLSPYCYPYVIQHIHDGSLKTDGMVTHTFPLDQWETAFDYASGKYGDIKVAITF